MALLAMGGARHQHWVLGGVYAQAIFKDMVPNLLQCIPVNDLPSLDWLRCVRLAARGMQGLKGFMTHQVLVAFHHVHLPLRVARGHSGREVVGDDRGDDEAGGVLSRPARHYVPRPIVDDNHVSFP